MATQGDPTGAEDDLFGSNAFVIRSGIPVVSAFCSRKRSPLSRWGVLANAARARNVAPGPHFPRRHAHGIGGTGQWPNRRWRWSNLEPMTGIELAYSAWEAISSAERPFYRGCSRALPADPNPEDTCVFGTFGTLSRPVRPWFGGVRGTHGVPRGQLCSRIARVPQPYWQRPKSLSRNGEAETSRRPSIDGKVRRWKAICPMAIKWMTGERRGGGNRQSDPQRPV